MPDDGPLVKRFIDLCGVDSDLLPTAFLELSPVDTVPCEGETAPLDGSGAVMVPVFFFPFSWIVGLAYCILRGVACVTVVGRFA